MKLDRHIGLAWREEDGLGWIGVVSSCILNLRYIPNASSPLCGNY